MSTPTAMAEGGCGHDFRVLNDALRALVDIFPEIHPEVFREMLVRVSPQSRLEVVTDQLLRNDAQHIQGRYRQRKGTSPKKLSKPEEKEKPDLDDAKSLPHDQTFRSEQYKAAVKQALYEEFQSLSHSAIKAVLAESNYHYTTARATLVGIASKSWRVSVSNFLFRRKTPALQSNPFITYKSLGGAKQDIPRLNSTTKNAELDLELYGTLIAPAIERKKEAGRIIDNALAHQLADAEAREAAEEYDCGVCYSSELIHKLAVCDDGGHYICFRCIERTIHEAIYGQGWARSVSATKGTMKCVDPLDECQGCIPLPLVRRALEEKEIRGESTLRKFEERLSSKQLTDSGLPLVHCPFCSYAEVDDLALKQCLSWHFKDPREMKILAFWIILLFAGIGGMFLLLPILSLAYILQHFHVWIPFSPFKRALKQLASKQRGLRFTCRSPTCGAKSCLRCHANWRDPHACYSSQLITLAKSIEAAQTAAVKRVCPRCNTGFVKLSGCNKMVCICGYQMCYLCRAEIKPRGTDGGGYDHFCQHFRMQGGRCRECDKCDLYREEDEKEVLKLAKAKAEREWKEGEGKDVCVSTENMSSMADITGPTEIWDLKTWERWLDRAVERLVVVEVD